MAREMRARLHLSDELEAFLQECASTHHRDVNDEIVSILSEKMQVVKAPVQESETDTLFSQGELYPWIVSYEGERVATVLADTGGHACDYICQTRWLSRLKLSAVSMDAELV